MATTLGDGKFRYEVIADWAKLPDGWELHDVAAVAVDSKDRVYVFNRGEHPMIVFDREGNFLRSWGEGLFKRAHGMHIGPDDSLYCTDDGDHTVRKCTLEGKVLLTIGVPGKPSGYMSGQPFHRCTHTALSPRGDIYVSDGYGNSRVHKYSPDGKLLLSWGEPGCDPGQFNIPHNICCDPDGWVYVADRENHRVQVFDGNGKYETQWNNMHRPCGLCMEPQRHPVCYIGEIGPTMPVNREVPESRTAHQHRLAQRRAARPPRRRARRSGAQSVHRAARHGGGFARRHLRRRGLLHRLVAGLSGLEAAAWIAQPAQAGASRLMGGASQVHSIADMRRLAQRKLPRVVFDFVDGGADDELALRRNEAAFADTLLLPRPLNGTNTRDQSVELFGERLRTPVLIGPTGLAGMLWPRGEAESARAAAAAGTVYTMSHASTVSIEDLAREVGGNLWMQVFVYRDRGLTRTFTERAHAAGYKALVLTIDNQVPG